MRIGIGISTHNRRAIFNRSLGFWRRLRPAGSVLVVVDDASGDPVPDIDGATVIRHRDRLGVAMTKNRAIAELMAAGCEHLFLADDDVYPVRHDWWRPYIESNEPHLSYQWPNSGFRRGHQWDSGCDDTQHFSVVFPRGVMLYAQRDVIDAVGGMDPAHGAWGGEHVEWQSRIHEAGLTTWPFADVLESRTIWYEPSVGSSFPTRHRRRILTCNGIQWQKTRPRFVPYCEDHTMQDFTQGPQVAIDPGGFPVLRHVLDLQPTGRAVEFGVGRGDSSRLIADRMPLVGFDSGQGLPGYWRKGFPKGALAFALPRIDNATMVEGWFADTLPDFDFAALGYIGLVHIDCDLYSSAKTVLEHIGAHLRVGTYVVFDEYWGYDDEQRAWREFAQRTSIGWTVVGYCDEQWAIRISGIP